METHKFITKLHTLDRSFEEAFGVGTEQTELIYNAETNRDTQTEIDIARSIQHLEEIGFWKNS